MLARLAIEDDEDVMVELARMQVEETLPHLEFSEERTRQTFRQYLSGANPTIFVVEENRRVIGYLVAMWFEYAMAAGHHVNQEVLYVRPDRRGTQAAARLVKLFNQWADKTGAKEVFMGVANGFKVERTTRFFEYFGLQVVGTQMRRIRG